MLKFSSTANISPATTTSTLWTHAYDATHRGKFVLAIQSVGTWQSRHRGHLYMLKKVVDIYIFFLIEEGCRWYSCTKYGIFR
jgi:hypothetical protein